MKTLISGIITLILAFALSTVAAYFSVVGLAALFAATYIPVIIMGTTLETGKLVAVQWLHSNWDNPKVNFIHKTYLMLAIGALMLITAIGIYGFLSKGHLEQQAPVAGVEIQIEQKQQSIKMLQDDNTRLQARLNQLDANIDAFLKGNKASQANVVRNKQKSERTDIEKSFTANNEQIKKLNDEIVPLKMQTAEVEAKLGPIKYVAQLFGWQDTDKAVRLVILIIMFAFDPLAIVSLISATISFDDYAEERARKRQAAVVVLEPVETQEPANPSMLAADHQLNENGVPEKIEEPITPLTNEEVEFVREVIESGNAPAEVVADVAPILEAPKPKRTRKPRVKKQPEAPVVAEETESQDYQRDLESFVKTAYQNEPMAEVLPVDNQSDVSQETIEKSLNPNTSWLGKPPSRTK